MVMKKWKCQVCGYIHTGDEPPEKCPVCGAPKSAFTLIEDPDHSHAATTAPSGQESSPGIEYRWKCQVCGYIHTGVQPPERCPVCGAPQERFERLEENTETVDSGQPIGKTQEKPSSQPKPPANAKPLSQITARAELLTRLHGHPIAVHIPNGVLPLTFLFTLLAVVFKSDALATTAKYNMIFVCLSMPIVLMTGVIDWFNRFNAQMTRVFKVKMACGAAVTALSLILSLWWTVQPDIYLGGEANTGLFLFLNLLDLSVAAVAGFYGGKLVFRD
jgi:rubredoxin/uncharacterized membrane protein